jgi:hypothetical protein
MSGVERASRKTERPRIFLPGSVKKLFWDLDPRSLRWDRDQEMIKSPDLDRFLAVASNAARA